MLCYGAVLCFSVCCAVVALLSHYLLLCHNDVVCCCAVCLYILSVSAKTFPEILKLSNAILEVGLIPTALNVSVCLSCKPGI